MIVGCRQKLHQDFAYDTHPRLFLICDGDSVKFPDQLTADLPEFPVGRMAPGHKLFADILPLGMELVGGTFHLLIGTHPVDTAHEQITEHSGIETADHQLRSDLKAWILFKTAQVDADDRNLLHACFLQGTADEADIVAGTASAAGLGDQDGCFVQVVTAGQEGVHDLSHHNQGRIAGIVVHIFQP